MDEAFEHIRQILQTAFNNETVALKQEISDLKDQINNLTRLLQEKDDQCRHIATVLQTKNAEWKSIKMKLAARKQRNKRVSGAAEEEDEVEVVIEQGEGEEKRERDRQCIIVQPAQPKSYSELLDECTQLPTKPPSPRTPVQTAGTQSHLDALIDLISDGDETEDVEPTPQKEKENTTRSNMNSSFTIESSKIQKRKSHARGCSCCDKFYSATRSPSNPVNPTPADSFLVSPNTPPGFWDTSFTPRQ